MRRMGRGKKAAGFAGALVMAGSLFLGGSGSGLRLSEAEAVVGRPLTPVSVAGVARRTTRRAAYVGAGVATAAAAATLTALPPGCAHVGGRYNCGGTYYRAAYDGPNVVYVVD